MGAQEASRHYGTQVKGALIMFVAVCLAASVWTWAGDARGAEPWRQAVWCALAGGCFLVLFVAFFVGLKVFVGGVLRELADHRPDGAAGGGAPRPPESAPPPR